MGAAIQTETVQVLLATYNGARYLEAQLDSLLAQSFADFTVLVSDDASNDQTRALLGRYMIAHPGWIGLLPPASERIGASANFSRLLEAASADYVLFCDQDDVWLPDKIALSLDAMARLAALHQAGTPLLVHTDLTVVDDNLQVRGESFFRFAAVEPRRNSIGALLLGNVATGCTIVANKALYRLARPIPPEALMHDHWLAQVAAALGAIACLDRPTVLYRQHSGNLVGAEKAGTATFLKLVGRTVFGDRNLRVLTSYSAHARVLLERYGKMVDSDTRVKIETMARLWQRPRILRFASLVRARLVKPTLARNIALAALVLRNGQPARQPGRR